ncbi:DUF6159 family protein [Kitasatospora sp. NPDC092948]|uniref:DUF6159 family protein n=1 Tax=Kitasatospora sp. NPDC092948 TaxID=3364088 RepID=UPI00381EF205
MRASLRILRDNRRLLVFPLLSGVALVLVVGGVVVPTAVRDWAEPSPSASDVFTVGAGYLLAGFVLTLCSGAMICAVDDVLRGGPARIGASFLRAVRHWRPLLAWSLLNTTVLLAIRQLERVPVVGWIMKELFSAGWALATYLALPAMMVDGLGVAESTRRSARMLRETFTRQVYGSWWIVLPVLLSMVGGFVAFMLGVESNRPGPAITGGAVAALVLTGALLVGATVSAIFRTTLYRDASIAA